MAVKWLKTWRMEQPVLCSDSSDSDDISFDNYDVKR